MYGGSSVLTGVLRQHNHYGPRLLLLGAICLYCAVFLSTYRFVLYPRFGYFGAGFNFHLGVDLWLLVVLLIVVPGACLPTRLDNPSNFLLWVLYFVVYAPAIILAFHSSRPLLPDPQRVRLAATLFAGFSLILAAQWLVPRVALSPPIIPLPVFWLLWLALAAACAGYLAVTLGSSARLLSLADVYLQRDTAVAALAATGSRFGGYAFAWMNGLVLPMLYAIGSFTRRWLLCVLAIAGYAMLFSVWGGKASLFTPVALLGLTLVLRLPRRHMATLVCLSMTCLLLLPLVWFGDGLFVSLIREWMVALIHQRTFTSSALLITQYLDFFDLNQLTLGSHVSGINTFVMYPYERDIPRTIGLHYYGGPVTANVNFWAQDGIAAFGLPGVVLMSIVCSGVFWLIDVAARHLDSRFVVLCLCYTATNFSDTGLFTTLVTGGLFLLIVSFWHMRLPKVMR